MIYFIPMILYPLNCPLPDRPGPGPTCHLVRQSLCLQSPWRGEERKREREVLGLLRPSLSLVCPVLVVVSLSVSHLTSPHLTSSHIKKSQTWFLYWNSIYYLSYFQKLNIVFTRTEGPESLIINK